MDFFTQVSNLILQSTKVYAKLAMWIKKSRDV